MKHALMPHQKQAITAISKAAKIKERTQIVMACGSGKTLVGLQYAIRSNAQNILVLLPSLGLMKQTLDYWIKNSSWNIDNFMCVCSDNTVADYDDVQISSSELPCLVSTSVFDVKSFFRDRNNRHCNIVFSTYQSADIVSKAMPRDFKFTLGIFDEAHKTAGRKNKHFALALDNKNIKIDFRLFMTATPKHYNITNQAKDDNTKLAFSMDDANIYGDVCYKFSFADAVEQGVICDYKVIISVITDDDIDRLLLKRTKIKSANNLVDAEKIAHKISLATAAKKHKIKKIIAFHSNVQEAQDFAKANVLNNDILTNFDLMHVNGSMGSGYRHDIIDNFKCSDKAILTNARCLTEGVDVPIVDCVAFLHPKKSTVDIIQAVGRAMRKFKGKKYGYVFVPLYLTNKEQKKIEDVVDTIDYGIIWDILNALKENDSSLEEALTDMQINFGETGNFDIGKVSNKIIFDISDKLTSKALTKSIQTKCVNKIINLWDFRYGELISYKKKYGHCQVPINFKDNPELGKWVNTQRRNYNKQILSKKRINRLNSIDFCWSPKDVYWHSMFEALEIFKLKHGNCLVPYNYKNNPELGKWVSIMRNMHHQTQLSNDRVKQLNAIGFDWRAHKTIWEKRVEELKDFIHATGHTNVPKRDPKFRKLGIWVAEQRTLYRRKKLPKEKFEILKNIGFVWNALEQRWDQKYNELKEYKKLNVHCDVPYRYKNNPELGRWVTMQRKLYKNNKLPTERIKMLEAIEFSWCANHN